MSVYRSRGEFFKCWLSCFQTLKPCVWCRIIVLFHNEHITLPSLTFLVKEIKLESLFITIVSLLW